MIEYKHKINGLAQQGGGIMPPLSHPHKGLPWAPPQSAPQDDRSPHPVRLASEAARRSQSPYNRGDTVAIWTLTGLVLAACGGGGGGGHLDQIGGLCDIKFQTADHQQSSPFFLIYRWCWRMCPIIQNPVMNSPS